MRRSHLVFFLVLVLTVRVRPAVPAGAPAGFRTLEQTTLGNGLHILVGAPQRTLLFSEVLLVAGAGAGTPALHGDEIAQVAAESLIAGQPSADRPPFRLAMAHLAVSFDFTVGREVTVFRFAVPTENTLPFLALLRDMLSRNAITDDVWDDAIARHWQKVSAEQDDAWQRINTQLTHMIWRTQSEDAESSHPGLANPTPALDRTALGLFREQLYAPANLVISIWGDLSTDELLRSAQQQFSGLLPRETAPREPVPEPSHNQGGGVLCLKQENAVPAALLVGVPVGIDNDRAFYAWQLAAHILGASYNSRLQHRLRTELQVVYTVEAAGVPVGMRGMTLRIACQTDQVEATRTIILDELRRITREPVTQKELDLAKALLLSRLKLDDASFRDQLYRHSLLLLGQKIRNPAGANSFLASFTPKTLLGVLASTIKPEEASTIIVSVNSERVCGGSHGNKP